MSRKMELLVKGGGEKDKIYDSGKRGLLKRRTPRFDIRRALLKKVKTI